MCLCVIDLPYIITANMDSSRGLVNGVTLDVFQYILKYCLKETERVFRRVPWGQNVPRAHEIRANARASRAKRAY